MNVSDLREYLDSVVRLETICYTDKFILTRFKEACDSIGVPFTFLMPTKPAQRKTCYIPIIVTGLLVTALTLYLAIAVKTLFSSMRIMSALVGIFAIAYTLISIVQETKKVKLSQAAMEDYEVKLNKYNEGVEKDRLRVQQEQSKKYIFIRDCELLSARHAIDSELLNKLYDADIIFPKYRNFLMVSVLHEYISTGRCEKLEGAGGGYDMLEKDISSGKVLVDMARLEANPEIAKDNQYIVYRIITRAIKLSDEIVSEERRIVSELFAASSDDNKKAVEGNKYLSSYCQKTAQACEGFKTKAGNGQLPNKVPVSYYFE